MRLSDDDRGLLGLLALYAGALLSILWSVLCVLVAGVVLLAVMRVAWWVLLQ